MKIKLAALVLFVTFCTYVFVSFGSALNTSPIPPKTKRVLINFRAKSPAVNRVRTLAAISAKFVSSISGKGDEFLVIVADVPIEVLDSGSWYWFNTPTTDQAIMSLIPNDLKPEIIKVEEDYRTRWIEDQVSFQATPFPTVAQVMAQLPSFSITSARPEIPWGIDRVHAPAAWQFTEGKGVRVAVFDTGIDSSHKDLLGQVDGGYDAISKSTLKEAWQDQNGHGTHVSGTIAAIKDGKGVVGVAPKARLYAVRVLDADGSGSLSDVIDGIIWCANNGMQVANMSLGSGQPSDTMQRALRYAMYGGVITVAASGNSGGSVGYPGAYPEVIGVSASAPDDTLAPFSSRGPEVDFIAPGVNVVSCKMGGGYVSFSGTSMATPHVTGLTALAVSQGWVGLYGPDGVIGQLKKSAIKLPGLKDTDQGAGMIDASKLVRE